jgi:hypothetical protein
MILQFLKPDTVACKIFPLRRVAAAVGYKDAAILAAQSRQIGGICKTLRIIAIGRSTARLIMCRMNGRPTR